MAERGEGHVLRVSVLGRRRTGAPSTLQELEHVWALRTLATLVSLSASTLCRFRGPGKIVRAHRMGRKVLDLELCTASY